ncbi:MAG: biotin/lipoyl-binding carrier protein [Dehalococcoidales bacterium]|nr:biotin/lipoyl-binding carrier protein [Dehalococcoidales bacterium]
MAQEIVEAPLTGKVMKVEVKEGDKIKEGDTVIILESMKMENPIVAPVDGTVAKINVTVNQAVKAGDAIAVIEF